MSAHRIHRINIKPMTDQSFLLIIFIISVSTLFRIGQSVHFTQVKWESLAKIDLQSLVPSGRDHGSDQFIAKVKIDGNTYHSRYIPKYFRKRDPLLSYGVKGKERQINDTADILRANVDVLYFPKGSLQWVLVEGNAVPIVDMIPGGYIAATKDVAYICRIFINGPNNVLTGSYQDGEGECFSYDDGKKVKYRKYEVLVLSAFGKAIKATIPSIKKM